MIITHELSQLDHGGVERVIRNIAKFDKKNEHCICAYRDGSYRKELEKFCKIVMLDQNETEMDTDVVHIHSGGARSKMAFQLHKHFPIVETIHSPCRSAVYNHEVTQRIGVSDAVSHINHKCKTVSNGLDFEELEFTTFKREIRKELGIPLGAIVIGRLGRVGEDKGLEDWILTCWHLQRAGLDFIPLIVGDEARNSKGYKGRLKLMCESLPLKNVVWAGHRDDVANVYQAMDIFLYPSPTEGFGLVLAEAMFCGVPVVTWKNEVNHELFGGYTMLVSEAHGVSGLVAGVKTALLPVYSDEIIPLAHEWVKSEYQAERMASEYQEIYEQSHFDIDAGSKSETEHVVST